MVTQNIDFAKQLLNRACELEKDVFINMTRHALYDAVSEKRLKIVRLILNESCKFGADVFLNVVNPVYDFKMPFYKSIRLKKFDIFDEFLKQAIKLGPETFVAMVNACDEDGNTVLQKISLKRDFKKFQKILTTARSLGKDIFLKIVNARDRRDETSFKKFMSVTSRNKQAQEILYQASLLGQDVVDALLGELEEHDIFLIKFFNR